MRSRVIKPGRASLARIGFVANKEQKVGQLLDVWVLAELLGDGSGSRVDAGKVSNGGERGGHGATITLHKPKGILGEALKLL